MHKITVQHSPFTKVVEVTCKCGAARVIQEKDDMGRIAEMVGPFLADHNASVQEANEVAGVLFHSLDEVLGGLEERATRRGVDLTLKYA